MTPDETYRGLTEAFNAGNLDGMVACYDAKAVFVIKPGRVTEGPAELRAALAYHLGLRARLAIAPVSFTRSDDVMLVVGTFTMTGTRADGRPLDRTSRFADVLRLQRDGRWLIAVDNPYGGESQDG
jgi:ketosteroid isomerase-like protein